MIKLMLMFPVQDGFTPLAVALQQGHDNDKTNVNVFCAGWFHTSSCSSATGT